MPRLVLRIASSRINMNMVALVTARGGSKGVPRKNLREVGGQPLIAWTIESAISSGLANQVIVSTDDSEIAAVAKAHGAEVPFMRPAELAGDRSPHTVVVEHAVEWLHRAQGSYPDFIVLLQPTSPLRTGDDIRAAVLLAQDKQVSSVVSVSEMHPHPQFATRLSDEGVLLDYEVRSSQYVRRQDLPKYYAVNGALYLIRSELFLQRRSLVPAGTYGYVMPAERSLDVDTDWDLHLADLILRSRCERASGSSQV